MARVQAEAAEADLDKIRIAVKTIQVIQLQVKEAKKREEEMLDVIAAEWSKRESQIKGALAAQARLLERQSQMAYGIRAVEDLRQRQLQLVQQQKALIGIQQQMGNQNQQPPPYQENAPFPRLIYGYQEGP